jgi:hypothetical protein
VNIFVNFNEATMHNSKLLLFTLVLIFWTQPLLADPRAGWGLGFGGGSLEPINASSGTSYQTSSVYGGTLDYQWPLGKSFSALITYAEHVGKGKLPNNTKYKYYKTNLLGAELRAWMGSFFVGVHGGQYYLAWIESLSSYSGITSAGGNGYGLGFETKSGWMFSAYHEQSSTFTSSEFPDQKVEGNRIVLGYRWP